MSTMRNEYIVTWQLYRSWTLERMFTGKKVLLRLIWFMACGWLLGVSIRNGIDIISLALCCLCIYFAVIRDLRKAKKTYDELSNDHGFDWLRRIELEEDQISITDGITTRTYRYGDIVNALERKDHFLLEMKGQKYVRLYKSGCIDCTADECWEYVAYKMDEAVK